VLEAMIAGTAQAVVPLRPSQPGDIQHPLVEVTCGERSWLSGGTSPLGRMIERTVAWYRDHPDTLASIVD
jgi:hypothetical protein